MIILITSVLNWMGFKYACNINLICFIREKSYWVIQHHSPLKKKRKRKAHIVGKRECRHSTACFPSWRWDSRTLQMSFIMSINKWYPKRWEPKTQAIKTRSVSILWINFLEATVTGLWLVNASTIFKMVWESSFPPT